MTATETRTIGRNKTTARFVRFLAINALLNYNHWFCIEQYVQLIDFWVYCVLVSVDPFVCLISFLGLTGSFIMHLAHGKDPRENETIGSKAP